MNNKRRAVRPWVCYFFPLKAWDSDNTRGRKTQRSLLRLTMFLILCSIFSRYNYFILFSENNIQSLEHTGDPKKYCLANMSRCWFPTDAFQGSHCILTISSSRGLIFVHFAPFPPTLSVRSRWYYSSGRLAGRGGASLRGGSAGKWSSSVVTAVLMYG